MAELAERFPEGLEYRIPYDTTRFVEASIQEVYETLIIAVVLVILVIFVFLQDWRATLVPCAARARASARPSAARWSAA